MEPTLTRPAATAIYRVCLVNIKNELNALREAGQKEYAHSEDNAFANFERVADKLDLDRQAVLMHTPLKHLDGITAHANGHVSQREPVTGRMNDLIVYSALLYGMVTGAKTRGDCADVLDRLFDQAWIDEVSDGRELLAAITKQFDHCANQIKFGLDPEDVRVLFCFVLSLRVLFEV